jgi:hypothetical protein
MEKVGYDAVHSLAEDGVLDFAGGIGISLGCFSLSLPMTRALLQEFSPELQRKRGKFDSDPHFWMPMTLPAAAYIELMDRKGEGADKSGAHHARMTAFADRFLEEYPELGKLGCVDIGNQAYWWDYGQLPLYWKNNRKLLEYDAEGAAMRTFFNIPVGHTTGLVNSGLDIDGESIVIGGNILKGVVRRSILVDVTTDEIHAEDSLVVAVKTPQLKCVGSLAYNLRSDSPVHLASEQVRADVAVPERAPLMLQTTLLRDGGKDWFETLPGNELSYDAVHKLNQSR